MSDKSRKAVPREPTDEMITAGWQTYYQCPTPRMMGPIWTAMFDAAPVLAATAPAGAPHVAESAMTLYGPNALSRDAIVERATGAIEDLTVLCEFAYQQGYHELGYDPVADVANAISALRLFSSAAPSGEVAALIERLHESAQWLYDGASGPIRLGAVAAQCSEAADALARLSAPVPRNPRDVPNAPLKQPWDGHP